MIFLRHIKYPSTQITSSAEDPLAETLARLPAIMPRSGMGFYIIDLFEVWKFHFQFLLFILFFHFVIENLLHVEDQSHKWRQMGLYTYCERYVHEIAITLNPKTHSQNWILLGFQLHTYTVVQLWTLVKMKNELWQKVPNLWSRKQLS